MKEDHMRPIRRLITFAAAAPTVYFLFLRQRQLGWGSTEDERTRRLPGDELIPEPDLEATRAIDVHAPADEVWPWIAQMGQGRAALYSYEFLENLIGCKMHNADRIVVEWQDVRPGDDFRLHPDVSLDVVTVEPGRALVVRGGVPMSDDALAPYDFVWAFVVEDRGDGTSRLIVRERYAYRTRWAPFVVEPVQAVSFVMTQKMLRGIRDRAERSLQPV
jgi:hypothetical protein